jgi:hypothetical protein
MFQIEPEPPSVFFAADFAAGFMAGFGADGADDGADADFLFA